MGFWDTIKSYAPTVLGGVLGTMIAPGIGTGIGAGLGNYITNKDPGKAALSGLGGYLAGPTMANMGSNIYDAATYQGSSTGDYMGGNSPANLGSVVGNALPSMPSESGVTPGGIANNLANYFSGTVKNIGTDVGNLGKRLKAGIFGDETKGAISSTGSTYSGDYFGGNSPKSLGTYVGNSLPIMPSESNIVPGGTSPIGGNGFNWGNMGLLVGGQLLGAKEQSDMMKQLTDAQNQSYQKYLGSINPPDAVKDARFNELQSQVLTQAPIMQRRISDAAASRGIKGQGILPEIAAGEKGINDAINQAYFNVYGDYNVPNQPPPVAFTPGTQNLMGSSMSDLLSMLAMQRMINPRG